MDNSFKLNNISSATVSPVSDEERAEMVQDDNLSNQFDQITGTQMKEIEVKKIEDEIIIKILESEYRDRKAGLASSSKKLKEYRKELSNSIDLKKRYDSASEALIKKFDQLKAFHSDVLLVNVNNIEKTHAEDKKTISELTLTFQKIASRDNVSKSLSGKLQNKASEVNSNISRQIEQRNEESTKVHEKITKSRIRTEALKKELNQQKVNNNLKDLLEKQGTRTILLEAESGKLQKQLKQELDALLQDKNKIIQEISNNKKIIQECDELASTLQSEIAIAEKNKIDFKRNVEQLKIDNENLSEQVAKYRGNAELLKNTLVNRDADMESELSKIKERKQSLIDNFAIAEESMQAELKKLYNELEQKKSLSQKLDNCQINLLKLNEKKLSLKRTISNANLGLEEKLKKTVDDSKRHEEIIVNFNKKKNNFELKIKELEQKKIQENNKLESLIKESQEILRSTVSEESSKLNTTKNVTVKKVQDLPKSVHFPSLFSYKLSDSDDSEDDSKTKYPKSSPRLEYTPLTQKKSYLLQFDRKEQSSSNTAASLSQSELFDNLFTKSSQGQTVTKTEDNAEVFKVPQAFSQYKKKTPQQKKKL